MKKKDMVLEKTVALAAFRKTSVPENTANIENSVILDFSVLRNKLRKQGETRDETDMETEIELT